MGSYPKAIGLSLVLLAAISSRGVSDTTSGTQLSIEWLVYKSDAIVIGKLVERSDGEIRDAVYQVSEVLMPHAQVTGVAISAGYARVQGPMGRPDNGWAVWLTAIGAMRSGLGKGCHLRQGGPVCDRLLIPFD